MALVDSTIANGSTDTPIVAVPTGTAADYIVVLKVTWAAQLDMSTSWPAGFTSLYSSSAGNGYVGDGSQAWAWKRLTGADSGTYDMADLGTANNWVMIAELYSGRHTTDPPVFSTFAKNTGANSSPATLTANGVTALDGDDLTISGQLDYTASQATIAWTWPSGFTESEAYSASSWATLGSAVKQNVAAGATGNLDSIATWTGGTARWGTGLLRIPAAAGGGGGPVPIARRIFVMP
jgi:hypothetical protein